MLMSKDGSETTVNKYLMSSSERSSPIILLLLNSDLIYLNKNLNNIKITNNFLKIKNIYNLKKFMNLLKS